jgi:hypothetical protein
MSTQSLAERIAAIDEAIEKAMKFQSMTVDGDSVTNPNIISLLRARKELMREEEINSGRRKTIVGFDLSEQNF